MVLVLPGMKAKPWSHRWQAAGHP